MNYNLDLIYGVDLKEYCNRIGLTKQQMINIKKLEINMLLENYQNLITTFTSSLDNKASLSIAIQNKINQKKDALKKLESWN